MKKVKDHYFHKARQEGYAARSVYKLEEIDRKRRLLRPGQRVLDLGCAPGSWLQYVAERVGPRGRVVGVDLQAVSVRLPDHATVLQADAFELGAEALLARLGAQDGRYDVVLSDMAPRTTGIRQADAARSADLVRTALGLAAQVLRPGGVLLCKVFQGADLPGLRADFRARFAEVSVEKPRATRSESVEVFLLGRGLQGG